jgi:hypothetical protein
MAQPKKISRTPEGRKKEQEPEQKIPGNAAVKAAQDDVLYQEQMKKYMNEMVEVMIFNTEKEDENYPVPISVNGETLILKRNEWHTVKRYFLVALKNAVIETFRTEPDPNNALINVTIPVIIQRFPHTSREIGESLAENARIAEQLADAQDEIKHLEARIQQMLKEGAHGGLVAPETAGVDA